ncbi:PXDN [Mytilus edulis]|uniref:PXDN n=1 Tax=Mytilus edulis TaxID=6550 RepID=A0A8S3TCF7_MYTED|nr:PXDN [Mytilus edulis]
MKKRCNMNIMSMDIILIFVFAVICAGLVKGTCPSTCSCVDDSSGSHVNCYSKYLGRIPTLPKDTYYLDLRYNNITEIDVQLCKEMPQLHTIYISFNLIIEIPETTFADCEQLYRIDLQYNKIRSIESNTFVNMTNLYQLYLYNNKIRSLVSYTFINLTNLYRLQLSHNEISTIEPFTFMGLPSLQYLYLHNNKIRSLESNTFINMTKLYRLELSGNPLNCDCSIFPFWSWLIERSSIGTTAKCSNGTLVTSLQSAALETCHPDNCQCFNGGKCEAMGYELICDCIGQWTGRFCQDSQCTSFDCGFGDCYIEPVNGTAQCLCDDKYVNYCPGLYQSNNQTFEI